MIKGAQKKMIVVKTAESAVFEEAYFVLRRDSIAEEEDMVREASRIIESHGMKKRRRDGIKLSGIIISLAAFLAGIFFGGGAAVLAVLL